MSYYWAPRAWTVFLTMQDWRHWFKIMSQNWVCGIKHRTIHHGLLWHSLAVLSFRRGVMLLGSISSYNFFCFASPWRCLEIFIVPSMHMNHNLYDLAYLIANIIFLVWFIDLIKPGYKERWALNCNKSLFSEDRCLKEITSQNWE